MSCVANLVLHLPFTQFMLRPTSPLSRLNAYMEERYKSSFAPVDTYNVPGPKGFEACLYLSAVNYLNTEEFLEKFQAINWNGCGPVQLMLKDQHDEVFSVFTMDPNGEKFI